MIKLSNRLANIASLVSLDSSVLDIGCDHALLDIYIYQNKIAKKVIASDINENALKNANNNIMKNSLTGKIETRLGNGLDVLQQEDNIDTVIISGMGAHTIVGILKNNVSKLKDINTIIIQSNTKLVFLRNELTKMNYIIDNELMIEDANKIYTIIKFVKGKKKYTKKELYFGPILLKKKNSVFIRYYKKELEKLNIFLKILPPKDILNRYRIKREIRLYKNVI